MERTGIPVAQTLMALGSFPEQDPLALQVGGWLLLLLLCWPAGACAGLRWPRAERRVLLPGGSRGGGVLNCRRRCRAPHLDFDAARLTRSSSYSPPP